MAARREELSFLPAALEIQETPPSPTGRAILWTTILLFLVAIIWASVGHVDIVAVAPGKIVPSSRVKVVQPLAIGVVSRIHVADGQEVQAGDILIELDATLTDADRIRLREELDASRLELARNRAFSEWLDAGSESAETEIIAETDVNPSSLALQKHLLDQAIREHRSRLASIDRALDQRSAELEATQQLVEKQRLTLPIISKRAASMQALAEESLVSESAFLELEQQRIEATQDLAAQQARVKSTHASVAELLAQRQTLEAKTQHETLATMAELEKRVSGLAQELVKAKRLSVQQTLRAPVNGVVQQLAVHTVGGVVTPAEQLMVIVPKDEPLEIQAMILNRDIGFVHGLQPAEIKVDAFPFTRYGTIEGELITISDDAVSDENLGLVYAAKIKMGRSNIRIDKRVIDLTPGMTVGVEIKTGKRRVIEYILSPLLRYRDESGRER